MGSPRDQSETLVRSSVIAGVRAAGILEEVCQQGLDVSGSLQREVVRGLAQDIGRQLDTLSKRIASDRSAGPLVDAALACADLATLAACNITAAPPEETRRVADAVRLAAHAADALAGAAREENPNDRSEYLMRDARGAKWRADLASRQADEIGAPEGAS